MGVTSPPVNQSATPARLLARELENAVRGEVRFDRGSRALYATDASNYRQVPIGVVIPRTVDDVLRTVDICRRHDAPILPRGCGTSLAGQCCNTAVVIDFSKYLNNVLEIDAHRKLARVQPGVILDSLRDQAAMHGLTYGPDPATHDHCTIGGMIGNNSCGVHSLMSGMTSDNVEELEILLYDGTRMRVGRTDLREMKRLAQSGGRVGEIYRKLGELRDRHRDEVRSGFPDIPRRVSGYNLPALVGDEPNIARALVGSEATCVIVLEATVRLVENPAHRCLVVAGYADTYAAADDVPRLLKFELIGLEGIGGRMVAEIHRAHREREDVALLPGGQGWLLAEFGGDTPEEAVQRARKMVDDLKASDAPPELKVFTSPEDQARIWKVRESALGVTADVPGQPQFWPGWEDSSVPPDQLGDYLRDLNKLLEKYGYETAFYGHFGQGCVHMRVDFDLATAAGIASFRAFLEEAAQLVVRYGGSLSGEHGDGQSRAELLPIMFSPGLIDAFREFKRIWDPGNRMNPGKVVDPNPVDGELRFGTDYQPIPVKTYFQFPDDRHSFASATTRCVGVGKCRRLDGGTMCPSFMVTREEQYSTRGRARLLFEMMRGNELSDGWRDTAVKDALDLCLACKGCKGDCPVNVDMATYKAEFLAHHYAGHLRPITAYTMGLIYWWARLASHAPRAVNAVTHAPLLSRLVKRAGGIAQDREVPRFAEETFKHWFERRGASRTSGQRVILWADTFNNHFFPATARAAVEVLEAAGCTVEVPRKSLCCGRPLYDYGFLTQATSLLRQILDELRPQIRDGVPVVVLEPSCASVFRDELLNLFPDDEDAQRLCKQTYLLSEFLEQKVANYSPPKLQRKALVHGHCHHKSVMSMTDEDAVLRKLGIDYDTPDDGCCGMAGAFGFERDHYEISIAVGERALLPAVRLSAPETLLVSDGFSCREQISQTTGRRVLHLAEVIQRALNNGQGVNVEPETIQGRGRAGAAAAAVTIAGVGLVGLAWLLVRRMT
jgi:FAD/FMN-containing dehydrogenase/Fe-S oxidoreductase